MAAAVAGLGVVYQPDFIVGDAIRRGELEPVSLDVPTGDVGGIHVLYSLDHAPPAKARAFSHKAVEHTGFIWATLGDPPHGIPDKWDGHAAERIVEVLLNENALLC